MATHTAIVLSSGNSQTFDASLVSQTDNEATFLITKDKIESFYIRGTYNYAEDCWVIPMYGNEINGITIQEMRIYDDQVGQKGV